EQFKMVDVGVVELVAGTLALMRTSGAGVVTSGEPGHQAGRRTAGDRQDAKAPPSETLDVVEQPARGSVVESCVAVWGRSGGAAGQTDLGCLIDDELEADFCAAHGSMEGAGRLEGKVFDQFPTRLLPVGPESGNRGAINDRLVGGVRELLTIIADGRGPPS